MPGYRELAVWQRAMDFVLEVYSITATYPQSERYGLVSHTQRPAVSVAANIAEGRGRGTTREFHRFVGIALGSVAVLETHILIGERLKYDSASGTQRLLPESGQITRMLGALKRSLRTKLEAPLKSLPPSNP
ncbi:MAG: four helix bundle protein [Planctomycetaceae bacterium]|nr:four helix bundle protein [Planctomycetales bacterium]MCB9920563.1 four helix bundle protein [Planctomycetaceae bacterium]